MHVLVRTRLTLICYRFAFWSFAGLLTIPWLFLVFKLVTTNVGRSRRIKYVLDEHSAPKVVIIMPCYNEEPEILLRTVNSLVDCEYPPSCLHIFLSFDGDQENELYLNTLEKLGVPLTLESYPKSIDIAYRRCRITLSRFPHGGKRSCQKKTFRLIDKVYQGYLRRHDDLFVLFIDSDCILDKHCIQNFMYEMELKPGSKRNMLAQTGIITSTTEKHKLITVLQDMEYIHGQLFERTVESGCGAVTCLPGALTMLRFSAFRKVAKFYFADKAEQCEDLFDYGKCHLGEDRWLTHLFMIGAKERYQIQMNTGAFCKTEAVQTFKSLLKQRRRWFLGFISNEVCMLTDIRLWKRYPVLLIIRLAQNTIRTTALLFFIMVISIISTSQKIKNLPVGFIAVSLGLNWILMLYFGAKLGRYKIMLYPLMFVINPFFNWVYMVYGIFTAGQRTWGGPRADAGKADEKTTPEEVVAEALATGDDLNVVPETFKTGKHTPLLPPGHLEGRFAPAEELPGGWYYQPNDSGLLRPDMNAHNPGESRTPGGSRSGSVDSRHTGTWSSRSLSRPRRVESFVGLEDAIIYRSQQRSQRAAGGAALEQPRPLFASPDGDCARPSGDDRAVGFSGSTKQRSSDSVPSYDSDASVSLPFNVPSVNDVHQGSMQQEQPKVHEPRCTAGENAAQQSLAVPPIAYQPSDRYNPGSDAIRNGRSPLARKSFTRLATVSPTGDQREIEVEVRVPRRSSGEAERRGRRSRRSISVDGKGRRRLSKQRHGSRDPSTGR